MELAINIIIKNTLTKIINFNISINKKLNYNKESCTSSSFIFKSKKCKITMIFQLIFDAISLMIMLI